MSWGKKLVCAFVGAATGVLVGGVITTAAVVNSGTECAKTMVSSVEKDEGAQVVTKTIDCGGNFLKAGTYGVFGTLLLTLGGGVGGWRVGGRKKAEGPAPATPAA